MKPVNEDKLVKLGQEFESSEWFPVAMHVGSQSKSLPSLAHIYGCRIAPIPPAAVSAGVQQGPSTAQTRETRPAQLQGRWMKMTKHRDGEPEMGLLRYALHKDKSSERGDPSPLEHRACRKVPNFKFFYSFPCGKMRSWEFCSCEWDIIPLCLGQIKRARYWWLTQGHPGKMHSEKYYRVWDMNWLVSGPRIYWWSAQSQRGGDWKVNVSWGSGACKYLTSSSLGKRCVQAVYVRKFIIHFTNVQKV